MPNRNEPDEGMGLCRQGGAVRQTLTKSLGMIEGETERLPEERDMSHLATGTDRTFAVEMEYRTRSIQQGSRACALHQARGVVPNEIHHDGWTQQAHFTKRHPASSTDLLLELGHAAGIKRVMA